MILNSSFFYATLILRLNLNNYRQLFVLENPFSLYSFASILYQDLFLRENFVKNPVDFVLREKSSEAFLLLIFPKYIPAYTQNEITR